MLLPNKVGRYVCVTRTHSILVSPLRYCLRFLLIILSLSFLLICILEFFQRQNIVISIATNQSPCERWRDDLDEDQLYQLAMALDASMPVTKKQTNVTLKPLCPSTPPGLDVVQSLLSDNFTELFETSENDTETESKIEKLISDNAPDIKLGGFWEPSSCTPRFRTAVVIPYRDRLAHLYTLQRRLHSLLQKQMIAYGIFVAEQGGEGEFNKGRLMNSAFLYIRSRYPNFDCIIFHDVDMLPEHDQNMYACSHRPKHLSPAVNEMNYQLPYRELVGGVFAIPASDFLQVNGYSNSFWGWGGEDDDMFYRLDAERLRLDRSSVTIGRYTMIRHQKRKSSPRTYLRDLLSTSKARYREDGLDQLDKCGCSIANVHLKNTHTHIVIDVGSNAPWERQKF